MIDATAFDDVIAEAERCGIPVIAFNCNAQPGSRLPTVGQELYNAGRKAAFHASPLIPAGSKVLITGHDGATLGADERTRGIVEGLQDMDLQLETLPTNNVAADVEAAVSAKLAADPQVRAIIATANGNTEGAGRAVEKLGLPAQCVIIGFDVSPEILRLVKADVVQFTIDQQPYAQGYYPVVQLALARRMGIAPGSIDTGARLIRKENVNAFLARQPKE